MSDAASSPNQPAPSQIAEQNWQRYQYAAQRGHYGYVAQAERCERFYLGGGLHWTEADRASLRETGNRPAYEYNEIMPAVNGAIGYQIHNRMDITFLPRGGMADTNLATIRSKVARQILDANKYHWLETQVFSDGAIEQRGYLDFRMCFDDNVFGDLQMSVTDNRDVVPDPDANTYDPNGWLDVLVLRWYSLDQIEEYWGKKARNEVANYLDADGSWGEQDPLDGNRNRFGNDGYPTASWAVLYDQDCKKYRVIDRQKWVYSMSKVAIYPTGDVKPVDDALPEQILQYQQEGAVISKRMKRKVRWTVTTRWTTIFDDESPYDRFTIVPFFFMFRRGRTRGMIDNAISPQETLNKALSQFIHIINTTANSGWTVEQNSLTNMELDDLKKDGSKSGLVIEFKEGSQRPEKIKPNDIPQGMDRIIDRAYNALKSVTVPDTLRGLEEQERSGIAEQTRQYAAQAQLAIPLDNLGRTRNLVGGWLDYAISMFYDNARQFRITETDPATGKQVTNTYDVNQYNPGTGKWDNDLTIGTYDMVIADTPSQVTFNNSQFEQAMTMRKEGVRIPDNVVVKHSNLEDKEDIIAQMDASAGQTSPLDAAEAALKQAQAALAQAKTDESKANAANTRVTSLFAATQTGQTIAQLPAVAPLADQIARSAGVQDMDAPPEIAAPSSPIALPTPGPAPAAGVPGFPQNTHPLVPAHPAVGADKGIEGGGK